MILTSYFWIIFVPIAANLITKLNNPLNFLILGETIQVNMDLPFSWKLFFYAACCFTVASVIFKLSCPVSIRNYKNYDDFKQKGGSYIEIYSDLLIHHRALGEFALWRTLQISTGVDHEEEYQLASRHSPETTETPPDYFMLTPPSDNRMNDAFFHIRSLVSELRTPARILAAFFYLIGLILVFLISTQNLLYVVELGL